MRESIEKRKKLFIGIISIIVIMLAIYLGGTFYFKDRFLFGTVINGVKASCMTVEEVESELASDLSQYFLNITGRDGTNETINGSDFGLTFDSKGKVQEIKDTQSNFKWILAPFKSKVLDNYQVASYKIEDLNSAIDSLSSVSGEDVIDPKNATVEYTEDGYKIVSEIIGNKINKEKLYSLANEAVLNNVKSLDLEALDCYVNPKFTSESDKVISARDTLDNYIKAEITYTFGSNIETVTKANIVEWVGVDENLDVVFDENKVRYFIDTIGYKYNTVGKNREFLSSEGKTVIVPGGNYGWKINGPKETEELISLIKNSEIVTREPIYYQKAVSHGANDYGNTYVEIDLGKQHIWFYKNGNLMTESDIVTGKVVNNWATPPGAYFLNYREKNAVLKGEDYETPVTFWMPFNGGIGLHDALWRTEFGKDIYYAGGSHGCVNLPYEVAEIIFNNIKPGDPVILY